MITNQSALPVAEKEKQDEKKFTPRVLEKKFGGVYFHFGLIAGKKNVFTTPEYLDMMAGAIKYAELSKDVKNLGFVIMPNFFMWLFKLSNRQNDPAAIYGEVKKFTAREILNNLYAEKAGGEFALAPIFRNNKKISRSKAEKILQAFNEAAQKMKKQTGQKYHVWTSGTLTQLVAPQEIISFIEKIKGCPTSERWQIVKQAETYPYLYLAEDWQNFCQSDEAEEIKYVETATSQNFDRKLAAVGV